MTISRRLTLSNDKKKTEKDTQTSENQLKMLKAPTLDVSKIEMPTEMLKLGTPIEMKKLEKPMEMPKLEITIAARALTKVNIALKNKRGLGDVVMTELEIAVAPMHRLCKKAGADRVSEAAAKELAKALEEIGVKIAKEALDYAMHAGRKTIKAEDIETATRKVTGKLFFDYY